MKRHLAAAMLLMTLLAAAGPATAPAPLVRGHAHNDYRHFRPLAEALECGFTSIEADVHVIGDRILVAHHRKEAEAEAGSSAHTLQALYLDPLRARAAANDGRIYPDVPSIFLLVDLKSDPPGPAYARLREVLKAYAPVLTTWDAAGAHVRAVTVIITGNHTHDLIARDAVRYCASDGTLPDLDWPDLPADLCPLISSEWKKTFRWAGKGPMPDAEKALLRQLVERAHGQKRQIRFWGAPDNEAAWGELRDAGVDLINTDKLAGLRAFLTR